MKTETLRPLLETYAYNILGSYEDARDVVQDIWLKLLENPAKHVDNYRGYLIKSVVNHAINVKKRQKKFLKEYPGHWLPEPVATERADTFVEHREILSYSLMVLMEKLTARERAVFILKEAYHYSHREIADTLDISGENSRQLFRRAKDRLDKAGAKTGIPDQPKLEQLFAAMQNREMEQLEALLHEDIALTSDGGGKVSAAMKSILGIPRVVKFLVGVYRKFYEKIPDLKITPSRINHQPALLYYSGDRVINCLLFSVKGEEIDQIYFVRNPDKLKNLR
ncbi:sigma-70 family RNA polymerase sigma factor [Sinomicrobium kalidii]|uniref:sigma-70 family RNA polymerase sigma factor n=1 Tax=Sinomicrobium kalidii TaxID=2900738 RepID=UPI001E6006D1|nr:sigma-70 family RNA polymerase sigma factor [Sinomicrobium kalidii]UGU17109.1 sigma-70 family RNA polymerase sigma factor [Sinomicrobium kalidii]